MRENKLQEAAKYGALLILLTFFLYRYEAVAGFTRNIFSVFLPFIIGGFIALVINVPAMGLRKILEKTPVKKLKPGLVWALSIILAFFLIVLVVAIVFGSVIPDIYQSLITGLDQVPDLLARLTIWLEGINIQALSAETQIWENFEKLIRESSNQIITWLRQTSTKAISSSVQILSNALGVVVNIVLALIFCIYVLLYKDSLARQVRKILYAFLSEEKAKIIVLLARRFATTLNNFFTGEGMEAIIFGLMTFVSMLILRLPFASSIAMINGLMIFIPYFGAFIGGLVGFVLIATISIKKALVFLLLFLVLQQLEGNIIYPKVVGDKVGLPGIWVMMSVAVGGGFAGLPGMIFAVPITTFLYTSLRDLVNYRLRLKAGEDVSLSQLIKEVDEVKD